MGKHAIEMFSGIPDIFALMTGTKASDMPYDTLICLLSYMSASLTTIPETPLTFLSIRLNTVRKSSRKKCFGTTQRMSRSSPGLWIPNPIENDRIVHETRRDKRQVRMFKVQNSTIKKVINQHIVQTDRPLHLYASLVG